MTHMTDTIRCWLGTACWEGHDDMGAYELTYGVAILAGYLFLALLPRVTTITSLLFYALLVAAGLYGAQVEYRQLRSLGRRRSRGTLLLGVTWITLAVAVLLATLPVGLAHLRGWTALDGWMDGPLLLALVTALVNLSHGLRLGIVRKVALGGVLLVVALLLPVVAPLRDNLYLATAFLVGGTHLGAGLLGRRRFLMALVSEEDDDYEAPGKAF